MNDRETKARYLAKGMRIQTIYGVHKIADIKKGVDRWGNPVLDVGLYEDDEELAFCAAIYPDDKIWVIEG